MSNARSRRAAIVGFHGFGNLGDEMILAGIEVLLRPVPITVTAIFGGPGLAGTTAFPDADRHVMARLLPSPAALRVLRRVDLLLLGGGGLINDHWPAVIPRYLAWIVAARIAGAEVAWIGVGVGPIRRRAWRWLARLAAGLSSTVLVRDHASARLLGGPSSRIRVIPDPALLLERPATRDRTAWLGMIGRPPVHAGGPDEDGMLDLLVSLAAAGRSAGLEPRLLMMAPSVDHAFTMRLADRLEADGPRPAIEVLGPTPEGAAEQIASMRAVVSVRLHGLLLSALAGVPCVPIAYDAKVTAAAEQLGIGDLVIHPDSMSGAVAERTLAGAQQPDRMAVVAERVSRLRARADEVRRLLP